MQTEGATLESPEGHDNQVQNDQLLLLKMN